MSNQHDPVTADLNRYLDEEDKASRYEDAVCAKAAELRGEWTMRLWEEAGEWYWCIMDGKDCVADEWTRTEDEAWVGMREGMDRLSRILAEQWIKDQEEDNHSGGDGYED